MTEYKIKGVQISRYGKSKDVELNKLELQWLFRNSTDNSMADIRSACWIGDIKKDTELITDISCTFLFEVQETDINNVIKAIEHGVTYLAPTNVHSKQVLEFLQNGFEVRFMKATEIRQVTKELRK